MALVSSKVAAGMTVLADHINKLWTDLTANHDHSTGKGGKVDHAELADTGDMSGFSHNHTDIETHLNGGGTGSEIDNPGGSMGVHGLPAAGTVMGNLTSGAFCVQCGYNTLDSTYSGDRGTVVYKDVSFATEFDTAPVSVIMVMAGEPTGPDTPSERTFCFVTTVTASGFRACWKDQGAGYTTGSGFYWIAMGAKS